jgi:hypothetical protein
MKQLFVCGDSWFTTDPNNPTQSFSGQLAHQHNLKLTSFARIGCSNFAIALQIDQAIKHAKNFQAPYYNNFILIGPTTPDRIELPIIDDNIWSKTKQFFNWRGWFDYQPGVYIRRRGLANIKYGRNDLSSQHQFLNNPTVISESLNNLAFDESGAQEAYGLDEERKDALKSYMVNLYDTYIKRQYDSWIISDAIRRVQAAGIPFLVYTAALYDGDYIDDVSWVPRENLILPEEFDYYKLHISGNSMSHLDTAESQVATDYIAERMKTLGFIQ